MRTDSALPSHVTKTKTCFTPKFRLFLFTHIKGFLGNRYTCGRMQSGMLHCIPVASSDMTAWLPQNLYRYLSSPLVSRLFDMQAKIGEKGEPEVFCHMRNVTGREYCEVF